jgi:hypothetical protein
MPRAWTVPQAARPAARIGRVEALWLCAALVGVLLAVALLGRVIFADPGADTRIDRDVNALLAGIPQDGQTLGAPTAPVTLRLFAELEDYSSHGWFMEYLPAIIRELVRTNIVKIEYRAFKTNTYRSETFVKQQAAALAAGTQDKLWNYVYTLYYEQRAEYTSYVTEGYLDNIARQVPALNIPRWNRERNADSRVEQVVDEDHQARADGIHVTPSYQIGQSGGVLKNFTGSKANTYAHQIHPTTYASAVDIRKAIDKIR